MYSVFRSLTLTDRKNIQQENNVATRKPGHLSTRKPLADRSVNLKQNEAPVCVKPKIIPKTVTPEEPEFDLSFFKSSYKEVKDNYNDILTEKDRLGKKGMNNIFRCFLDNPTPKEPTFLDFYEPELIEIDSNMNLGPKKIETEYDADEISNIFKNDFNINLTEVPFPCLDFDF